MKKFLLVFLSLVMLLSPVAYARSTDDIISDTADYIYKTVSSPAVSSVGGEWAIIGLARSDEIIPSEYFEKYYRAVEKYVKECDGVLHKKKYTEYSRVILALTAIGREPTDVAGYNLLTPLGDYEKTVWQGVNGAIWALIALDSKGYSMPKNRNASVQATREMYINHILERQTSDGGWALTGDKADPDVTGMALQALSKYQSNSKVKSATKKALACLSGMQNKNGGFSSYDTETSESSVQVLVALCELGISVSDKRFVKNSKTIADNLLTFYNNKGFKHTHADTTNQMATEQCFYALVALKRAEENKNSLYDMSDVLPVKTFKDTEGHESESAIEKLASRGIINGKTENTFEPDSTMTRAEFATIIVRGLGLSNQGRNVFKDVTKSDWFYTYVSTAYTCGIINGVSENKFNPNGIITREEAAVMVARAAKHCGLDTGMTTFEVRDVLAQFPDYVKAAGWSQGSLAFCYKEGILSDEVMNIKPKEAVTRAEIADMLCNMLTLAQLL